MGFLATVVAASLSAMAAAQSPVPVGKGSYAAGLPSEADEKVKQFQSRELYLVKEDARPIPTNQWWTDLIVSKYARSLWAFPFKVDTSDSGTQIFFPTRWAESGNDPVSEFSLDVGGQDFKPADARAKQWSDWGVVFRMGESASRYFDVTLVRGVPFVWIEYSGVTPQLKLPSGADANFFDRSGKPVANALAADCLGIEYKDRCYGVFAPDGTRFEIDKDRLRTTFSGKFRYLVIGALPARKDLSYFYKYAFAIPRDTQLSWNYDAKKGTVTTTWKITTEVLKGSEQQTIQGWLPHHYRNTTNDLAFTELEYLSPRGKLRCATGNEFQITYPFAGIIPNLPAPKALGGKNDYDPGRMRTYFNILAAKATYGEDTYWGGKDILRFGQDALMAQQTGDESRKEFVDHLQTAMIDWLTFTPAEKSHYFVHYPRWKGLVGWKPSYGSEAFNDHHFHYGYFTWAAALLGMHDRQFLADYGEMARLVAKEYANWDRADKRFPFLRTFDVWEGHSWAGGTSSPGGNNQESTSEAVQSWAGLILLGQALGDKEMTATGVAGYCMETQSTLEYWFNSGGDVFPPQWKHAVTGMVWSGGKVYGTYFTGDPAWIYGIQWLPASPALSYLVRDPKFARQTFANMVQDFETHEKKPGSIKQFGPALGSVMCGYVLMYDPAWVAVQLDALWAEPDDKVAHDAAEIAIMYYMAHSMRALGQVDWKRHGSIATSMVYFNDQTKQRTYVVWNPLAKPQTVSFYEGEKLVGQMIAAPQSLTSANKLMRRKKPQADP